MYSFRKSKKGFTLIELMIVVVIIGILALLGLRLYLTQIAKANDALIKANAGTIQTTIQSALSDETATSVWGRWADPIAIDPPDPTDTCIIAESGIHNPMTKLLQEFAPSAADGSDALMGEVWVYYNSSDAIFYINGSNHNDSGMVYTTDLVAKY